MYICKAIVLKIITNLTLTYTLTTMKYIPSIAFEEMSGSAKGVTAAKTRGRKYIRTRRYGGSTRTEFQASVKSVFKQLAQSQAGRSVLSTNVFYP